ncbi:single-stranded DNA-binding protein 2-like [Phodopus roborovskii]|uniref:single-stranded DNA-binding protein 2-like n=1 Tax=Phodopus roborovskii TaxID=109678 RepID=UPI0021E43948|nr:single-stranded DNA-binding protein 2-like [Phodopus roborovskii]
MGKKTPIWGSLQDSYILGGVYFGISTVQLQRDGRHVNTQSEAKAFHDYSAASAPSPVLGNTPPGDGMPVGPVPPGFFQPFMSPWYPGGPRPPLRIPNQALGGIPGSQPLLPSGMDPTRQQGHPNMGGPMQRMTPPRGMVPLGPQNYGGAMRPPLNALGGPGMPAMNMGPGGGRPWPNANSIPYSSASPGNYVGPPGGGGPPGTPIMPSPANSTNSGDNMYTLMNTVPPGPNRLAVFCDQNIVIYDIISQTHMTVSLRLAKPWEKTSHVL